MLGKHANKDNFFAKEPINFLSHHSKLFARLRNRGRQVDCKRKKLQPTKRKKWQSTRGIITGNLPEEEQQSTRGKNCNLPDKDIAIYQRKKKSTTGRILNLPEVEWQSTRGRNRNLPKEKIAIYQRKTNSFSSTRMSCHLAKKDKQSTKK